MIPDVRTVEVAHLASGDTLSIQVYRFCGATPGQKAYLQANLHGAEVSGNVVIAQLVQLLQQLEPERLRGEIWLVPTCNPFSTNQRSHHYASGRYNPYTGHDWNRIFWDYEKDWLSRGESILSFAETQLDFDAETIAHNFRDRQRHRFQELADDLNSPKSCPLEFRYRDRLQSLCLDADYVLDLHSSANQSFEYLYCFRDRQASTPYFLFDYGILLNDYDGDAFDEAFLKPWLALEAALAELGKPTRFEVEAWTLELGSGMQANPDSVYRGTRGIKNYLAAKKMLDLDGFPLLQTSSKVVELFQKDRVQKYYAPRGGIVQSRVLLGSFVQPGQRLYQLLVFDRQGNLPEVRDVCAEREGVVYDCATNHTVNQGEYVLGVMERPSVSVAVR